MQGMQTNSLASEIPLSILDQSPVRCGGSASQAIDETIKLAKLGERLGYKRFWVAEHHTSAGLAGVSPEILLSRIGMETSTIRIGSAAILLTHYSPFKVAENFKLLASMYQGRVDCGVGRAPGADHPVARALRYSNPEDVSNFPERCRDLNRWLNDIESENPSFKFLRALPRIEIPPQLWVLGANGANAELAGAIGVSYGIARFINPSIDSNVLNRYRQCFRAGGHLKEPCTSLTVFAICADTEAEALRLHLSRELWYLRASNSNGSELIPSVDEAESYQYNDKEKLLKQKFPKPCAIGAPEQVRERLRQLVREFEADEIVIVTIVHDFYARCRSYELIADAWGTICS